MALPEVKAAYEKSLREGAKILTELSGLHDTVAAAVKPLAALNPQENMGFGPGGGGPGGFQGRPQGGFGGPGGSGGEQGGAPDLMQFDKNGDGKLFKAELPERLQGIFDRADANKDKQLTKDELATLVARQPQKLWRWTGRRATWRRAGRPRRHGRNQRPEGVLRPARGVGSGPARRARKRASSRRAASAPAEAGRAEALEAEAAFRADPAVSIPAR